MVIDKVGAVILKDKRILLVRKINHDKFIIPGGKRDGYESDLQCLRRELKEEIDCNLKKTSFITEVHGKAEWTEQELHMKLYLTELIGDPRPSSEIEELVWIKKCEEVPVSKAFKESVYPELIKRQLI